MEINVLNNHLAELRYPIYIQSIGGYGIPSKSERLLRIEKCDNRFVLVTGNQEDRSNMFTHPDPRSTLEWVRAVYNDATKSLSFGDEGEPRFTIIGLNLDCIK